MHRFLPVLLQIEVSHRSGAVRHHLASMGGRNITCAIAWRALPDLAALMQRRQLRYEIIEPDSAPLGQGMDDARCFLGWDEHIFRLLNGNWLNPILDRLPFDRCWEFRPPFVVAGIIIVWVGVGSGSVAAVSAWWSRCDRHLYLQVFFYELAHIALADVRLLVAARTFPIASNHAANASVLATLASPHATIMAHADGTGLLVGYSRVSASIILSMSWPHCLGIVVLWHSLGYELPWPLLRAYQAPALFPLKIGDCQRPMEQSSTRPRNHHAGRTPRPNRRT
jgi:hypothetical protein